MNTVVIPWKSFWNPEVREMGAMDRKYDTRFLAAAAVTYKKGAIMNAAKPVIDILQDVAEPIAYGMMLWGLIKIIMSHEGEGIQLIKKAGWGYVFVQLLPWLFSIIKSIGAAGPR